MQLCHKIYFLFYNMGLIYVSLNVAIYLLMTISKSYFMS